MSLRRSMTLALVGAGLCVALACGSTLRPTVPNPAMALTALNSAESSAMWSRAEAVFENRCVVCHGCYDAPCQLKLGTFEGILRGGTGAKVYDGSRLLAADPTRLEIDAHDTRAWRKKGFHAVLPEDEKSDPRASLLVRMLDLKRNHPLTASTDVPKEFTLELDRKQTCTTADKFDDYAKEHPTWGMPYALPALDPKDDASLVEWVNAGAPHGDPAPLPQASLASVDAWESFLNEPSLKGQLVGRYIYEHLFLASLYFKGIDDHTFFRLVRSRTPRGTPLDEIPTRRPFDDPKTPHVYYRFVRRLEKPLEKTHMPYPLSAERLKHYRDSFMNANYAVDQLPTYEPEVAANPFRAFEAIPAVTRYRFMLEEAQFTMMGFIKGPVCRGQVALDVIEDRFWIAFLDPGAPWMNEETAFLSSVKQDLDMPAEGGSTALPTLWFRYGDEHARYVRKEAAFLEKFTKNGEGVTPRLIWNGDGSNTNAALTVFRHFDSASVVKGFVGDMPKTAWVVGYPLLERIHYLLVAGFDVFGNVSHQVTTRLYMDFLRMEGETNFLMFLPPARRKELIDLWYRGVTGNAKERVVHELAGFQGAPRISYRTAEPERELFPLFESRLGRALANGFDIAHVAAPFRAPLGRLAQIRGIAASHMPEMAFVTVRADDGTRTSFTVLRESGHTNVAHLFFEEKRRILEEDALAVADGFLGAYPNALFDLPESDLPAFVDAVTKLDSDDAYRALRARFGVLRTSDRFWTFSDRIHEDHRKLGPAESGTFDYNRLEGF